MLNLTLGAFEIRRGSNVKFGGKFAFLIGHPVEYKNLNRIQIILILQTYYQNSEESVTRVLNALEDCLVEETDFLSEEKENISKHCSSVSKWADDTSKNIQKESLRMATFWESKYKKENPTGTTPKRKQYEYPRILSFKSGSYTPSRSHQLDSKMVDQRGSGDVFVNGVSVAPDSP
jgi:hypothetical protein